MCVIHTFLCTCAVLSFIDLAKYLFSLQGVKSFLSEHISQDPLEKFFGMQRQRGRAHENPNTRVSQEHTGSQSDKWNMHGHCQRKLQGQETEFPHDTRRTGERKSTTQEEKKVTEWKGLYFIRLDMILHLLVSCLYISISDLENESLGC